MEKKRPEVFEGVTVLDAAIYDEAMRPLWAESRFVRASAPARAGGREAAAHSFLAQQVREVDFGAAFGDSWTGAKIALNSSSRNILKRCNYEYQLRSDCFC